MRTYSTVVEVLAPGSRVWKIMSDVERWPEWTPTMSSVRRLSGSGTEVGASFGVKQPGLRPTVMSVTEFHENESFTWTSTARGLTSTARHRVIPTEGPHGSATRVELDFEVDGPTARLVWFLYGRKIRRFVDVEAASLKKVSEELS